VQAPPRELPIFQDLGRATWKVEEIEQMSSLHKYGPIELVFEPWRCWRCHQQTIVFHAGAGRDPDNMIEATPYTYWPDILAQVDEARRQFGLPLMGVIKPRYSKTIRKAYVSQGCRHCDAIVGEFPMSERFLELCTDGGAFGDPGYKYRAFLNWPPASLSKLAEQMENEDDD
jgi:hypothetical protein